MAFATVLAAQGGLAGRACPLVPKPPTLQQRPGLPGPRAVRRHHRCVAAASTQQVEGVASWLAGDGVDVGKQAAAPGAGGGLVCSRAVKAGEQLFAIPESAWITPKTAEQSDIGSCLAG